MSTTPVPSVSCETLEAECNVLGMELLNVLEFIGDTIDYRKITLLVQWQRYTFFLICNLSMVGAKVVQFHGPDIKWRAKIKKYRNGGE